MPLRRPRASPYLLIILLPVVLVTVLAGALNLASFDTMRESHREASERQAGEIGRIAAATHMNQEIASIQRLVSWALEQAAAGELDEAGAYIIHVNVVNRLAALERQFPLMANAHGDDQMVREARAGFDAYRNFIITATDLAAIDPAGAMRYTYQAANSYVALSQHTHAIAGAVVLEAAKRGEAEATAFQQYATKITMTGGSLVGALLLLWFAAARWLTRRLSIVSVTLKDLADGNVDSRHLPEVQAIGSGTHSVLRDIARAVTAFREAIVSRQSAEQRLLEKNKALERSNAELESFAFVASHDLREPLRNVTAFSTLLARRLDGRLREDEQELLRILIDAATRMNTLVLDLLEVSRVGRSEQTMEPVALGGAVAAALDNLKVQIADSGAVVEVPPDLPLVMGNGPELARVVMNIIGNALKYRSAVPPVIRITWADDGPAMWRFEIEDNGLGIETGQDYEERIFGLFQRLHQRDEYGGGTGIGLPICRKIINRYGGRIWVESQGLGTGSRFIFTLPKG